MPRMPVRQVAAEDKRGRKQFVALEQELVGDEPLFVPEIAADVDKRLRGRSPFYEEMEHSLFVASNGRDLARCAAFVNRRWQRDKGEAAGFIGYFAAVPDAGAEVAEMLEAAERWLAERGATRVIAPFNGAITFTASACRPTPSTRSRCSRFLGSRRTTAGCSRPPATARPTRYGCLRSTSHRALSGGLPARA